MLNLFAHKVFNLRHKFFIYFIRLFISILNIMLQFYKPQNKDIKLNNYIGASSPTQQHNNNNGNNTHVQK